MAWRKGWKPLDGKYSPKHAYIQSPRRATHTQARTTRDRVTLLGLAVVTHRDAFAFVA